MAQAGEVLSDNSNIYYLDPTRRHYIFIYPQYINSKRTKEQGRKVSKENAIDNPTAQEIRDVCLAYGFDARLEPKKRYPQDPDCDPNHIGRVRVKLKNEDGSPCNPEFDTKRKIVNLCGQRIPKLTSRQKGTTGGNVSQAAVPGIQSQETIPAASGKDKANKKKNKKR